MLKVFNLNQLKQLKQLKQLFVLFLTVNLILTQTIYPDGYAIGDNYYKDSVANPLEQYKHIQLAYNLGANYIDERNGVFYDTWVIYNNYSYYLLIILTYYLDLLS